MTVKKYAPLLLIAALALPVAAYGADFLEQLKDVKKNQQLAVSQAGTVYEINDDASFAAKTKAYHLLPFQDPNLEFEISVPTDWVKTQIEFGDASAVDRGLIGDVVRFTSPFIGVGQATIFVRAQQLEHEISATHWLKNYLLASGYNVDGEISFTNKRQASTYYSYLKDGGVVRAYAAAQINGRQALVATFEIPANFKDYMGFLQKKTVDSVKLTYPNTDMIEQRKQYTVADAIKLSYPASWQTANANLKDVYRMTLQLLNKNDVGTVEGYISIIAIRRREETSLRQEIENLRKHFTDVMKIKFEKLISSATAEASTRFAFKRYEVYDAAYLSSNTSSPEIRLAAFGDEQWYIFIYLITPKENINLGTWARNVESFEQVIKMIE